jgi:hypothetical protein
LSKYFFNTVKNVLLVKDDVAPKSFSLPESVLGKSKACFRRLQNSPSAQTLVIAYLTLRQDSLAKTLSRQLKRIFFGQRVSIHQILCNI